MACSGETAEGSLVNLGGSKDTDGPAATTSPTEDTDKELPAIANPGSPRDLDEDLDWVTIVEPEPDDTESTP